MKRFLLPLFFLFSGLNYIFEFFVLIIGQGYQYRAYFLRKAFLDNVFGSVLSQLMIVPTIGLFLTILNKKMGWTVLFATLLSVVERLFIKLRLFKHYWWFTAYTFIGLIFFFNLAHYIKNLLIEKQHKTFYYLSLYFSIFVTHSTLMFFHVAFLNTFLYNVKWFKNPYRAHVTFATLYVSICSLILCLGIAMRNWYIGISGIFIALAADILFIQNKLLTIHNRYFYVFKPLALLLSYGTGMYIHSNLTEERLQA